MSSDVVFSAVRAYLDANWSACPITYENETFSFPAMVDHPGTPATWIYAHFVGTQYDQASLGSGNASLERWVEEGYMLFEVYTQAGSGSLLARQRATALATLLRGVVLGGNIRMNTMSIGDGSDGLDNGKWWGLTLRVEFARG